MATSGKNLRVNRFIFYRSKTALCLNFAGEIIWKKNSCHRRTHWLCHQLGRSRPLRGTPDSWFQYVRIIRLSWGLQKVLPHSLERLALLCDFLEKWLGSSQSILQEWCRQTFHLVFPKMQTVSEAPWQHFLLNTPLKHCFNTFYISACVLDSWIIGTVIDLKWPNVCKNWKNIQAFAGSTFPVVWFDQDVHVKLQQKNGEALYLPLLLSLVYGPKRI